ncbi:MAG: CDP-glycerol glycerophosphotransferase family protein [Candidatus Thermoplasmatota archaeon]|nr:CDP-glycerol glycerophosphotransferase family protein [Candidatus Thermoplasmatota archaeon]
MEANEVKNKAMFVCSRRNHFPIIKPVLDELENRGWKTKVLRAEIFGEALVNIEKKLKKINKKDQSSIYEKKHHICIWKIISHIFLNLIKIGIISKFNIFIVVTDAPSIERSIIYAGKMLKIPSLRIQIGLIGHKHDQSILFADKMAISGEATKKILTNKCKINPERLVITGCPVYDKLVNAHKFFNKRQIIINLKLIENKKIIVFTTENLSENENKRLANIVCKSLKNFTNTQLIIKVHPGETDLKIYKNIAKKVGIDFRVIRDINIYEILYISDILITYFSATGLEAMILKKPVITLNPFGGTDPVGYATSGATLIARTVKELKNSISIVLNENQAITTLIEKMKQYVYKQSYKQDGMATKRVADLIEEMAM